MFLFYSFLQNFFDGTLHITIHAIIALIKTEVTITNFMCNFFKWWIIQYVMLYVACQSCSLLTKLLLLRI